MKKLSKLRTLSPEDQKRILELCAEHTYDAVATLIAKPRDQGGLDCATNRSALSRFYRERGSITINGQVASQFLDLMDEQPFDIDDLIPSLTHLLGQSAFLLLSRNRPFDEYRRPLDAFLRLERLSRERDKLLAAREEQRRLKAEFDTLCKVSNPHMPASQVPSLGKPRPQPPAITASARPENSQATAIKLDYTLPSFKAAAPSSSASKQQPQTNPLEQNTIKFPEMAELFSDLSGKNPGNLTNLTKSHVSTLPSAALPCR